MIKAERMIKKYDPQFPWSPKLAISILKTSIWKLVQSELKTNTSRDTKLQNLTTRLHKHNSRIQKMEKNITTTTSPCTRHLEHYISFLVYDGQENDPDQCSFNHHMLQTVNNIINATIPSTTLVILYRHHDQKFHIHPA